MKSLGRKMSEWIEMVKISRIIKGLFFGDGWLKEKGWLRSAQERKIIDAQGRPLPWYSYSAIEFLKERLTKDMTVFEYGGGFSTWFYADRVKNVCFVDHDSEWYKEVMSKAIPNISGRGCKKHEKDFLNAINMNAPYDLIVVDCIMEARRIKAIEYALRSLTERGVILLDDAEQDFAKTIRDDLLKKKFKSLKFWGGAPGINYFKCTEIFYRENNIFNI